MSCARRRTAAAVAVALSLALTLSGCAGPRAFTCEARGGRAWREYRSQHFHLYSDATPKDVAELAERLERYQAQLAVGMAGEGAEVPGRILVVAFEDKRDFIELAGPGVGAYFGLFGFEERPAIVLPVEIQDDWPQALAHELGHHLSRYFYPRQPLWFAEGLAGFVETVATHDPSSRGRVGAVDRGRGQWLARTPRLQVRMLLTATSYPEAPHDGRFHLWSWLLYHWLWNERSEAFTAYQVRLAKAERPAAAWRAAFPEFDPASDASMKRLEDEVEVYRRRGRFSTWLVHAPFDGRIEKAGPVAPADVHVLLWQVRRRRAVPAKDAKARWRAEIEEVLAEAPFHPVALAALNPLEKRSLLPEFRSSAAARPDDWRAWFELGRVLRDDAGTAEQAVAAELKREAEAATRKALALAPDQAGVQNNLAWYLVADGRSGEALPLARRAVEQAPWNAKFMDTLAYVAADLGRCREALSLQERAVELRSDIDGLRTRLDEYRKRCGDAGSPTGPAGKPGEQPATSGLP